MEDCSIHSDSITYSTTYNMVHSTFSNSKLRDYLVYEHCLNAYHLGVTAQPKNPPPNHRNDFLSGQEALFTRHPAPSIDLHFHPEMLNPHHSPVKNVYMPVETLNSIIKAIRQSTHTLPILILKPLPINHFIPKQPPLPNFN